MSKELDDAAIWDYNATFWDEQMGDESNIFHREVVRPKVSELLDIHNNDYVLEIACGNGNFAAYLANKGASVVGFDASATMIQLAKTRHANDLDHISLHTVDATKIEQLQTLQSERKFTKAVSTMAFMDISELSTLFSFVYETLQEQGTFVFATQHPCFITPQAGQYKNPHQYIGEAIPNQPMKHRYYHRSLEDIFQLCFKNGFVIDGFYETYYKQKKFPDVIIVRVHK